MINMRKVDYMGSEPYASKLLFAPANSGSENESNFEDEPASSLKTVSEPPSFRHTKGDDLGSRNGNV